MTNPTDAPIETTNLYYRDGGSDKIYNASIHADGDGYVVRFSYGRRGSALQAGTKTASPVAREKAKAIFDKLVEEKTSKGYTAQEGGQLFAGTEDAGRLSGNVPQLLNDATDAELAALLAGDDWVLQTKFDGKRIMLQKQNGAASGSNRKGLLVALPQELHDALLAVLPDDSVLDGELIGAVYYAFDTTRWAGASLNDVTYGERVGTLAAGLSDGAYLRLVETSAGAADKAAHLERIRNAGGEGVVLKRLDAPYRAGRPASGGNQRKFKFTQSATCRVLGISDRKRSAEVGVLTEPGADACVKVGNVTILPNFAIPAVGSLVEIKYLYYYEGGSLYQPIYQGERDDKTEPDAHTSLKRKAAEEDE